MAHITPLPPDKPLISNHNPGHTQSSTDPLDVFGGMPDDPSDGPSKKQSDSSMTLNQQTLIGLAAILSIFMWTPLAFADGTWEVITREGGVVVSEKTFEDRDLPIFRGVGYIDAHILDILAVLNDTTRATEWMHNCADAVLITTKGDYERTVYNRTDAPWPVNDRDVVVKSKVEIDAQARIVVVHFKGIRNSFRKDLSGVGENAQARGPLSLQDHVT